MKFTQLNHRSWMVDGWTQDRRIEDFKTELKNKDEEYIKMLKQQRVDITTLISKMREQYHSLRQHYEQQLGEEI